MPDFFAPLTTLLGSVLAATHALTTASGLAGAAAWVVAIALLTCVVRLVLLPFAVHGARHARRAAAAAPALRALQQRYAGRRDPESLRRFTQERRAVQQEHGLSATAGLALLLQLPILLALYHLMTRLSDSTPVGALTVAAVASASVASIGGVHLGSRLATAGPAQAAIILGLALVAGGATWLAQRRFPLAPTDGVATSLSAVVPWISLVGVVIGAFFVPTGVVLYWTFSNTWTLGQQAWLSHRFS